jgi:hypothetical protein
MSYSSTAMSVEREAIEPFVYSVSRFKAELLGAESWKK